MWGGMESDAIFFMWGRFRSVRTYMKSLIRVCVLVGCVMCNMCGIGYFCDCAYLCGIGVDCFEDQGG